MSSTATVVRSASNFRPVGLARRVIATKLKAAGITINGDQSCDPQVLDERLYTRVLLHGSLGLGEAYMEGWWECEALDQFFHRILNAGVNRKSRFSVAEIMAVLKSRLINLQSVKRAWEVGEEHYDAGNDLYQRMLDSHLVYTCGYWKDARSLDDAQQAKLDLVCRKIGVKATDHLLDMGCGWGGFARFAAEKYGASVDGITISKEQVAVGNRLCAGLPVQLRLMDYRRLRGTYDHIVSMGMLEHVGERNYRTFFEVAARSLKDDGLFLLHTVGSARSVSVGDAWMTKHIFPNGMLPSLAQIGRATEGLFVVEDLHNFGAYYDKTLMHWFKNFDCSWAEIKGDYPPRFYRKWKYYLLSCAGACRSRYLQLWQFILSKKGVPGGYLRPE